MELQALIDSDQQERHDLQQFLRSVRKYTDPEKLMAEMLNELIDRIVVHAPDKSSGKRKQKIEIYYKAAGIINITDDDCIASDGRGQWRKDSHTAWKRKEAAQLLRCTATIHIYFVIVPRINLRTLFLWLNKLLILYLPEK